MMLRYGFSGTNWTRKSTTIKRLTERLSPQAVEVFSLSPLVAKSPHPMIQKQTAAGSEWMVEQVTPAMTGPKTKPHLVFDRTPLDIMAFTRHALDTNGGDESICKRVADLSAGFDAIFFCRPGGEWPAPMEPTEDVKRWALHVDELMDSARSLMQTDVIELPWDTEARLADVLQWVERNGSKDA